MPLTDISPTYRVGTATFAASTAVVGQGTAWLSNAQPGDLIYNRLGQAAEILSVNSDTSITLAVAFAGTVQTAGAYMIQRLSDSARLENFSQRLLNLLTGGSIMSFGNLDGSGGNKVPVFTGPGAMAARSFSQLIADMGLATDSELAAAAMRDANLSDLQNKRQALDNLELLGATVASAGTLDLSATTGRILDVSGTATITSVVIPSGSMRVCRFSGAAKITTGANLILNNGTEVTHQLSAGDIVIFWSWGTVVRGQIVTIDGRSTQQLTTGRIKGRASAGTGLVEDLTPEQVKTLLGIVPEAVITRSAAMTVTVEHRNNLIVGTGTWTLSLAAAATLGNGFNFAFRNGGTGIITLDPAGSELINGGTTQQIYPGDGGLVFCDATGWHVVGLSVLAASVGATGYRRLAGGKIEQWGKNTAGSPGTLTWPIAFPTAPRSFGFTMEAAPANTSVFAHMMNNPTNTNTGVTKIFSNPQGSGHAGEAAWWTAWED